MSELVLIDTDILIDMGRAVPEAIHCLQQLEAKFNLAISVITQLELWVGCRNTREFKDVEHFFTRFQKISLNEGISDPHDRSLSTLPSQSWPPHSRCAHRGNRPLFRHPSGEQKSARLPVYSTYSVVTLSISIPSCC